MTSVERNPLDPTDPSAPAFAVIEGNPYPLGLLCYILMLPGATDGDREAAVRMTTADLDRYHRRIGGAGLVQVREGFHPHAPGRWEWVLNPNPAPGWDDREESQRMALVALRLRRIENRMQFGR